MCSSSISLRVLAVSCSVALTPSGARPILDDINHSKRSNRLPGHVTTSSMIQLCTELSCW